MPCYWSCFTDLFFFFFSSRRRHTRSLCDWSSDVCSSDLLHRRTFGFSSASSRTSSIVRLSLAWRTMRSEEHTSNSSHTVISYAVFCLKKKNLNCNHQLVSEVQSSRVDLFVARPHEAAHVR